MAAAFLVSLPEVTGLTLLGGFNRMVVWAADATDAKAIARSFADNDAVDAVWALATATQIQAAAGFDDYNLRLAILDSSPVVDISAPSGVLGAVSVAINAGGTGYTVNDILTVSGGTSTRAARLKVTSVAAGVIDGIALVDPGEYTALPANPAGVTGGTGTGATFNLTGDTNDYKNVVAAAVSLLNATTPIAAAALDLTAGANGVLTIAGTADNLGDKTVVAEFRRNGVAIPSLLGAVTHQGAAGAALSVALVAAPVAGTVVAALKQ